MWLHGSSEMMTASLFYNQKGTAFDILNIKKEDKDESKTHSRNRTC